MQPAFRPTEIRNPLRTQANAASSGESRTSLLRLEGYNMDHAERNSQRWRPVLLENRMQSLGLAHNREPFNAIVIICLRLAHFYSQCIQKYDHYAVLCTFPEQSRVWGWGATRGQGHQYVEDVCRVALW